MIATALSGGSIFLATCNAILFLRDVNGLNQPTLCHSTFDIFIFAHDRRPDCRVGQLHPQDLLCHKF